MTVALLDVNVLVALFDLGHPFNDIAHRWLSQHRSFGWATCPITLNGCVRILSNASYGVKNPTASEITAYLHDFCATNDHHFWPDSVSLLDESLFHTPAIKSHHKITDAYLLGLAVRNHGRLATFDHSIPLKAVHGAKPSHLAIID